MLQILYLYNHAKSIWILSYELNASYIIYYIFCIRLPILCSLYYLFCIIFSIYFPTIEPHI